MGVHDGHRERLKSRFMEHGLDSFNELNALELLLFYAIPRKDTNVIAHALLDRFGSLSGVFDAGTRELMEIPGIGENAALLIKLVPQMMKKSRMSKVNDIRSFRSSAEMGRFLVPRFMDQQEEVAMLLCLDSRKSLISCEILNRGVVNAVDITVRRMVELALKNKAVSLVLAHNHPEGIALPSREDEVFTHRAGEALRLMGMELLDHIIVAGDRYFSMRDSGLFGRF